jgi:hypothetical protein
MTDTLQPELTNPTPVRLVPDAPTVASAWEMAAGAVGVIVTTLILWLVLAACRAMVQDRQGAQIAFRMLSKRLALERQERIAVRTAAALAGMPPVAAVLSDKALHIAAAALAESGARDMLAALADLGARRGLLLPTEPPRKQDEMQREDDEVRTGNTDTPCRPRRR